MEQKTIPQYRSMVRRRAFHKAMQAGGLFGKLGSVAISLVASLLLKFPTSVPEFFRANAVIIGAFVLIIYIVLYLWFFGREPVILHNEQQADIGKLQVEKQALIEKARPRLELSYDENDDSSSSVFDNKYDFRIKVKNAGGEQIRDLEVVVKATHPKTFGYFPVPLHLSHSREKTLNSHAEILVDVVEADASGVGYFSFYTENVGLRNFTAALQDYEILLAASGHNSPVTEKWFRFSVNRSDQGRQLSFKEGNQ